jgi:hypothetical protein
MTVEELFKKLSYGELSNLAVAVDKSGTITKDQQPRIIHFANEGLMRLHSRFPLSESSEIVTLVGSPLDKPLAADVLLVSSIMNAYGASLTIEAFPIPGSIHIWDRTLRFPAMTAELQITYQHQHPVLTVTNTTADLEQVIALMPELHEALTAYIASKIYGNMNSPDSQAVAAMHHQRSEMVISQVQAQGLLPGELLSMQKLERRGFV